MVATASIDIKAKWIGAPLDLLCLELQGRSMAKERYVFYLIGCVGCIAVVCRK